MSVSSMLWPHPVPLAEKNGVMTQTVCMEVDDEVLLGMDKSPEELAKGMRLAVVK